MVESCASLLTRISRLPVWFIVPPKTALPTDLDTGMDSPVSMASSSVLAPSVTIPSSAMLSPGRTMSTSPTINSSMGRRRVSPPRRQSAWVGRSFMSELIALRVRSMA